MPSLRSGSVTFRSNVDVVQRVEAQQAGPEAWWNVQPKGLAPLYGFDQPRCVHPLYVLHLIGKATTPASIKRPEYLISWTWAFVRYLWAFECINDDLTLSAEASALKYHHRQTLSEYMGIGFALEAAERHLMSLYPRSRVVIADAEEMLDRQGGRVEPAPGNSLRPDYLLEVLDPSGGRGDLWVLECKGSKSTDREEKRLAKAARQVESVRLVSGGAPSGLICSTVANDRNIVVTMLDPEGDPRWRGGFEQSTASVSHTGEADFVDNPGAFRLEALTLDSARMLTWVGAFESAASTLPGWYKKKPGDMPVRDAEATRVRIGERAFTGIEMRVPTELGVVSVFRGLASELHSSLLDYAARPDPSILPELRASSGGSPEVAWDESSAEGIAIDSAGAMTRIVIA